MAGVLVTGAAGGLGCSVVRALKSAGIDVKALVRPGDPFELLPIPLENITMGHVQDPAAVSRSMQGIDAVVHCAALLPNSRCEARNAFFETNVRGTSTVLDGAIQRRIRKAIFVSTLGVVDHVARTVQPSQLLDFVEEKSDPYVMSKVAAERLLHARASEFPGNISIVRPGFIYGPGSLGVWQEAFQLLAAGRMMLIGTGQANLPLAYADDVAAYIVDLLKPSAPNKKCEVHIIANPEPATMKSVFDLLADCLRVSRPRSLPLGFAVGAASVADMLPAVLRPGRLAILTKMRVRQYSGGFDISGLLPVLAKVSHAPWRGGISTMAEAWVRRFGYPERPPAGGVAAILRILAAMAKHPAPEPDAPSKGTLTLGAEVLT
jgi:2-alkyl-3-oxoalkanoate reductase